MPHPFCGVGQLNYQGENVEVPDSNHSITALIDKHHVTQHSFETLRPHLGCSTLGHPCDRWLWLSFRFAVKPTFPGRVLRMFAKHIAEFKTHSTKSFADVVKQGVEKSKLEHFVQMQLYMSGTGIERALYVAINKDDDSIYTERLAYDKAVADKYIARGHRIAQADRMPEPLSTDPSWYQCKWCPAYAMCHEAQHTKEVNCRTCAHSTAKPDSTWHCARHDADDIPLEWQVSGCESHVLHPDMVHWKRKDGPNQWTAIYVIDGKDVANGDPDAHIYSSKELLANPSMCALGDEDIERLRVDGARVVG
jgi:hypothetical protein